MNKQDLSLLWWAIHHRKGEIHPPAPKDRSALSNDFTIRMQKLVSRGILHEYGGLYYVTTDGKAEVEKYRGDPAPKPAEKKPHLVLSGIGFDLSFHGALISRDVRAHIHRAGTAYHLKFDGEWIRNDPHPHRKNFTTQLAALAMAVTLIKSKPLVRTEGKLSDDNR